MGEFYAHFRARLVAADLWPQGWVARGACYSLALALGLFVLKLVLQMIAPVASESLEGWVEFLLFDAALLFCVVAFRWLKRRILWRLRNRLIVTYVFIGVIPAVLLIAMASITIYLFAGQFASFVVTSEINGQLRSLQAVNAAVSNELAARIEKGEVPTAESLAGLKKRDRAWVRRRVHAWHGTKTLPLASGTVEAEPLAFPDFFDKDDNEYAKAVRQGLPFKEIVRDKDELYLRVVAVFPVGKENLIVVTSEPLDKDLVANIAENLGEITLSPAGNALPDLQQNDSQDASQPDRQNQSGGKPAKQGQSFQTRLFDEPNKNGGKPVGQGETTLSTDGKKSVFHPIFTVGSLAPPASTA